MIQGISESAEWTMSSGIPFDFWFAECACIVVTNDIGDPKYMWDIKKAPNELWGELYRADMTPIDAVIRKFFAH